MVGIKVLNHPRMVGRKFEMFKFKLKMFKCSKCSEDCHCSREVVDNGKNGLLLAVDEIEARVWIVLV